MMTPTPSTDDSTMRESDPQVAGLLEEERLRQANNLTLIASENHCSRAVRQACSSSITDKYAEGYPGARYYGGCEVADKIENLAISRALDLFEGAEHANVQPHSGTTANLAALQALAETGAGILGMALSAGGHLSHGYPMSHTGKIFTAHHYGVNPSTGLIELDEVRKLALEHKPEIIIAGASSYPRAIDYAAFAEIAAEVGAKLLADIAHPAGLIAAGLLPSPIPHADVVTMTTHKTLRGPRGGMILARKELAKSINRSLFPGAQGGPLVHQIAGKAVAFGEALAPGFRHYQQAVKDNTSHLADQLLEMGLDVVTGGTDTHLVLIDLRSTSEDITGAEIEARSLDAGLAINKNMVPDDPKPPRVTSGIRLGTAAVSTRGMGTAEMETIAKIIYSLITGEDPGKLRPQIQELSEAFPLT